MILVISRDDALIQTLANLCVANGDRLRIAATLELATELARREPPLDALILDLDHAGPAGYSFCRALDERQLPIVVAGTALAPLDRYESFASGASDVLSKPIDPVELGLRLRARLGSRPQSARTVLVLGDARVDLEACEIRVGDRRRGLTPHETAILRHLVLRVGQCVPTEELLVQALGYPPRIGNPEVVRTHIRHLREKLEPDPARPQFLVNVPRVGYRISGAAS